MVNLNIISDEQKLIIEKLKNNNLIIEAVAGSGKTTTSLYIAQHFTNLKILLLTYNAKLKQETRKKVTLLQLSNIEVHSFHAFGFKYYQESKCVTDRGINEIIDNKKEPKIFFDFDLIIIDEAQDITPLYYEFISKIINDNKLIPKLCLLGDKNQSIYSFNNADARYLSLADHFFNFNNNNWLKTSLTQTFRVNDKIVDFINKVFYQKQLMNAYKTSRYLPEYILVDAYNSESLYKKILEEISIWGYENIFILAPSLRSSKSPVRFLSNRLSTRGIKVFVPSDDDEKIQEQDLKGKLVFSTFHQSKGLERQLVIVFGFDNSYFSYYDRNHNKSIPPNALYVALTRASEKLILIHHYRKTFLPFLDSKNIEKYCNLINFLSPSQAHIFKNLEEENISNYEKIDISVTELTRHVPQNILNTCMKLLTIKLQPSQFYFQPIKFISHVQEKGYIENVSSITGVAIPLYYELVSKGKIFETSILKILLNLLTNRRDFAREEYPDLFKYENFIKKLMSEKDFNIKDLLFLANLWIYIVDKFNFKLNQISPENYNWINENDLNILKDLISKYVLPDSLFEQEYKLSDIEYKELYSKSLTGYIDCIDTINKNLWEFKCVNNVKDTYFLQLAIYVYLFETKRRKDLQIFLKNKSNCFDVKNIKVGDTIEIHKNSKIFKFTVTKLLPTKMECMNSDNGKTKKFSYRFFYKNISYEKWFLYKKQLLEEQYNFLLFNINKNEVYKLNCEYNNIKKIVDLLIWNKYFEFGTMSDNEFMEYNNKIKSKYVN